MRGTWTTNVVFFSSFFDSSTFPFFTGFAVGFMLLSPVGIGPACFALGKGNLCAKPSNKTANREALFLQEVRHIGF